VATLGIATADTERGRVTAAGGFLWGQTTETTPGDANTTAGFAILSNGRVSISRDGSKALSANRSDTGELVTFHRAGTDVGSIDVSAGATAYNTSSDRRLKENITAAPDPGAIIDALEIVQFDLIGGAHIRWGVIAQDAYEVLPEAITAGDTGETVTDPWGSDPSKAVYMLVKELQLLRARVAALEAA
jgi:hypothetical protein